MNQRVIKKVRCNICSAGCPIDAYVEEGTLVSVEGSRDLPGQSGGYFGFRWNLSEYQG